MKLGVLVGVLLLFSVSGVKAESFEVPAMLRTENINVLLLDEPCQDKDVLQFLEDRVHPKYRQGAVNHKVHGFRSLCYLEMEEFGSIFIIDDQFEQVDIPKERFKPTGGKPVNLQDFRMPETDV